MIEYVGSDDVDRRFYAVRFTAGCLQALPWKNEMFDCTIFACNPEEVRRLAHEISAAVVDANTDWVNTTGPEAEWLHDLIDRTSVERGRQEKVGDGSPMTDWHEGAVNVRQMAEAAYFSAGQDCVVALVVGDERDFSDSVAALEHHLTRQCN